jgi:tetratricopeptide (TPR) repeat protein
MTSLRFVLVSIVVTLIMIISASDIVFSDESEDVTKQLAEKHMNLGQLYEQEARELANNGDLLEATNKFELAAEQYSEAAIYYHELNDHWNAAKYNAHASLAHEESAIIHSELNDYSKSLLHYLLSDKFKAHSLQHTGIAIFGDGYLLPPKFQAHLVNNPQEIICKEGLELVFKIDDSPACVSPSSKIKLIERGWAK